MTKQKLSILGVTVAVAVILVIVLQQAGVFSLRDLAGVKEEKTAGAAMTGEGGSVNPSLDDALNWASPASGPDTPLRLEDLRKVTDNLPAQQRRALLADSDNFKQFAMQEARNRSLLTAARANNLHEDSDVRFVMQRAAENALRQIYMRRLIRNQLPDGFPSDEQIRTYYENNREQFRLGDRIHVWQIFIPSTDDESAEAAEETAGNILEDIRAGRMSFSQAALAHSAHQGSKNNGGYMGLVKTAELRPELADSILSLEEGEISDPIIADNGVHIVKKGETVAGRDVELNEIRGQIRQLLLNQAGNQLQQAIYEKAAESYPVESPDNKVEEWRLRIRTDTSDAGASASGG